MSRKTILIFLGAALLLLVGCVVVIGMMSMGIFRVAREVSEADLPTAKDAQRALTVDSKALERLSLYQQTYSMDHELKNLVAVVNDQEQLAAWADILTRCERHRPNHPDYNQTYIAVVVEDGDELHYWLRVDANSDDVDLVPFEIGEMFDNEAFLDLGTYRCRGLQEWFDAVKG